MNLGVHVPPKRWYVGVLRVIEAQVALLVVVAVVLLGGALHHAEADTPAITLTGASDAQAALFDWALERFEAARLRLPPVHVVVHDTNEPCSGRDGAHTHASGRSTIHLCTTKAGPAQEFLVLHELAHAWDRHALTEDRRHAFLVLRGLSEWRNDDPERWHDRGAEHAAEIITWGLMDRPVAMIRLVDNRCSQLRAGYLTLVGHLPLEAAAAQCSG